MLIMPDKNLYIIAGCNGAGKTTASFTILPEILNCREFIGAGMMQALKEKPISPRIARRLRLDKKHGEKINGNQIACRAKRVPKEIGAI